MFSVHSLKCTVHEMKISISGFFAFSENLVFSDYKNTSLTEKFKLEVC